MKKKCTAETTGYIAFIKIKGLEHVTMVTVKYEVDGTAYEISESVKLKSKGIKLGPVTIGQKTEAVMGETAVGTEVKVMYDPENPAAAYIPANAGINNI